MKIFKFKSRFALSNVVAIALAVAGLALAIGGGVVLAQFNGNDGDTGDAPAASTETQSQMGDAERAAALMRHFVPTSGAELAGFLAPGLARAVDAGTISSEEANSISDWVGNTPQALLDLIVNHDSDELTSMLEGLDQLDQSGFADFDSAYDFNGDVAAQLGVSKADLESALLNAGDAVAEPAHDAAAFDDFLEAYYGGVAEQLGVSTDALRSAYDEVATRHAREQIGVMLDALALVGVFTIEEAASIKEWLADMPEIFGGSSFLGGALGGFGPELGLGY